jgi:ubiquinone/menaquinone biosynthesis C-methylase UbiE
MGDTRVGIGQWYERRVLPRLIDVACGASPVRRQREKIIPGASGRVLELGFGSGRNLPHYDAARVDELIALEPSADLLELAATAIVDSSLQIRSLQARAEAIPEDDASVDTVVITYTLCSIDAAEAALAEVRRILRPGGRLLFCEHGAAPDPGVHRWQRRVTPVWRRLSGGCRLDRDPTEQITAAGFRIDELETMYLPGWRPATFNYWGCATRA